MKLLASLSRNSRCCSIFICANRISKPKELITNSLVPMPHMSRAFLIMPDAFLSQTTSANIVRQFLKCCTCFHKSNAACIILVNCCSPGLMLNLLQFKFSTYSELGREIVIHISTCKVSKCKPELHAEPPESELILRQEARTCTNQRSSSTLGNHNRMKHSTTGYQNAKARTWTLQKKLKQLHRDIC